MTAGERTIVIGASGQVGSSLLAQLGASGIGVSRNETDFSSRVDLVRALDAVGPVQAVINAAAYNNVDGAESERGEAFLINADLPGWLAEWSAARAVPFVHYSTEYVFPDGNGVAWSEDDAPAPLNVYGESKLAGERAVQQASGDSVVIRTSWLYSTGKKNFVRRVLELAASGKPLSMVSDQVGSPTDAADLARATLALLQREDRQAAMGNQILHLAGSGSVNRTTFTRAIIEAGVHVGVIPHAIPVTETTTSEFVAAARRPTNCVLDCSKARALGIELAPWRESLSRVVQEMRA
ncbi:MAG: dTDP-4-dehydrorhamnose reductase [Chloroflexi bacterium]|nr:dTDP-4-dehydrorhamnose reductase [Chloroflexota bacterium]